MNRALLPRISFPFLSSSQKGVLTHIKLLLVIYCHVWYATHIYLTSKFTAYFLHLALELHKSTVSTATAPNLHKKTSSQDKAGGDKLAQCSQLTSPLETRKQTNKQTTPTQWPTPVTPHPSMSKCRLLTHTSLP